MKKWFFSALALVAVAVAAYYYVMNKPHRSVEDETALSISAESLFQSFQENETDANAKYLNNVLQVEGIVKSVEMNTDGNIVIVLETADSMFGVNCTMDKEANVKGGDKIILKGICTGYLADVVINQAVLIKSN